MNIYIHHIETLTPPYAYSQDALAEQMSACVESVTARIARQLFRRSGIARRHSVLPDFGYGATELFHFNGKGGRLEPSTEERNRRFISESDMMSVELARRALANAEGFSAADITHVVTVSCTGFYNPGPDYRIVTELGLSPTTERYHLGFMGCYAAFPALRMAQQFCLAQPDTVALVVCLELCTLHLQIRPDPDTILANALFADGAAAAIVSARTPSKHRPALAMQHFFSALAPEGKKDMAWEIGNAGFNIVLSSYVPDVIGANVGKIVDDLLARSGWELSDVDLWAVHPGGKAILDKIEKALALHPDQLTASRNTLRDFGNMSSATVLFVLKQMLEQPFAENKKVCAMAFGPGLVIESSLMERVPARVISLSRTEQHPIVVI